MLVWKKQIKKLIIKKRSAAKNFARPSGGEAEGGRGGGIPPRPSRSPPTGG